MFGFGKEISIGGNDMSTASEMYHAFGLGVVECSKTEYVGGVVKFHVRTPSDRVVCSVCRGSNVKCRGCMTRDFRLVPIGSRETFATYTIQRVECLDCGIVRQEPLKFAAPYRRRTRAFERYVVELSAIATVKDVAKHLGVAWSTVREIQQEHLKKKLRKRRLKEVRRIGIDELAIGKGHKYVTIVLDLDSGAIVFVGEGKDADSVIPFLRRLKRIGAKIEAVALDMGRAYPFAVHEVFPKAKLVYDRFHVVKLMNEKLTELRREMHREATELLDKNVLKGTRWLLLKNADNLDDDRDERKRLEEALALNKPLATAYYLKEELRLFWEQDDKKAARRFLRSWIRRANSSGITVIKTMAKTLQACRTGLLNYYDHRLTSGPLEGMNNKVQTMKRQAYGYRNMAFFKLKLLTLHEKEYALVG